MHALVELWPLIIVSVGAFVATNVDSLLLLLALMGAEPSGNRSARGRHRAVSAGYLASFGGVVAASWFVAKTGDQLPASAQAWIGLVGLVPLGLGLWGVWGLWRRRGQRREGADTGPSVVDAAAVAAPSAGDVGFVGAALLFLSLGGDNFGVFVPLFADTVDRGDGLIALVLVGGGLVWLAVARSLSRAAALRVPIQVWGGRGAPFFLIGIGIYILANSPTDLAP